MTVVNFSHPLTASQKEQLSTISRRTIQRVIDIPVAFDEQRPFPQQAAALVDTVGLSGAEWQTLPLVVNLPAFSIIAALVLVEIHGRAGYFPSVLRLRPTQGTIREFELSEVINLQAVRDSARSVRSGNQASRREQE